MTSRINTNNFAVIAFIAIIFAIIAGIAPSAASASTDLANGFITGTVWNDSNRNGVMEPTELPLANREVYLQRADGEVNGAMVAVVITDSEGMFKFENLEFGKYLVFPDGGDYVLVEVQGVSAHADIELPVVIQARFSIFVPSVSR
jgi:hypothetical protein